MIESLELTNWKTHQDTKLTFQKGVNVMIGVMGAGKSSAMDAISYALFGTFPALKSKRVTTQELVMSRPAQKSEATVRLIFTTNGDTYVVTRKLGENGSTAKLDKNGVHLQSQSSKVTEEIESILKIDYDTFSRVVYSEQNRLDYFLELPKGDRKKQIDQMLGLDSFATAEENTTSLLNNVRNAAKYESEALSQIDLKSLKGQHAQLSKEKEAIKSGQERMKKEEASLKSEVERARNELEKMKKIFAEKKKLSDDIAGLQGRVNTLNEEIKKIAAMRIDEKSAERLPELVKSAKELDAELERLRKEASSCTKQLGEIDAGIKYNEDKVKEHEKLAQELKEKDEHANEKAVAQESAQLQEMNNKAAAAKSRKTELHGLVHELDRHLSKCPVCERELTDEMRKRLLDDKKKTLEENEKEIRQYSVLAEEAQQRLKKLQETQSRIAIIKNNIAEFSDIALKLQAQRKEKDAAQEALEKISKSLEKVAKDAEKAKEAHNKAKTDVQTIERKKSHEEDAKKAATQLAGKRKEHDSISIDEKAMYAAQESITKLSSSLSEITSKMQGDAKLMAQIDIQLSETDKRLKEYEAISKRIEKRQSQVNNLNKFKVALVETEAMLRTKLVNAINNLMQDIWPQLYPYGDYQKVRLNAQKDDYLLEVSTVNAGMENWLQVDGVASGGERSVASLTLRIALAMVTVPNLRWLILDEPTHNIDTTGIAKLIDVLGASLPKLVEQIFIITHDDNLRQISSARVYQFDRDKATNAPTLVSQL